MIKENTSAKKGRNGDINTPKAIANGIILIISILKYYYFYENRNNTLSVADSNHRTLGLQS